MSRVFKMVRILAVATLVCAGAFSRAEAAPIISIDPASQMVGVGGVASVDIKVTGLTDPTGGFYILLGFDDSILSGLSIANDPSGALGPNPDDLSGGFGPNMFAAPGQLDLFFIADPDWNATDLAMAQSTGFILATVTFDAVAPGLSPLTLLEWDLSNADGSETLDSSAQNGQVCVGTAPCEVPEPALFALFATGLATLAATRRRRRA